jgi:hypothetical protein
MLCVPQGRQDYGDYLFYIQPFRLPAIASRSGEAGGDERLNRQAAFSGNDIALVGCTDSRMGIFLAEGNWIFSPPSGR